MEKQLPKNWVYTELNNVVFYKKGKKPKILNDLEFDSSVPYLDIKAFEKDEIRRYADIASSNLIEESDIGIVWDGARSGWVSFGKTGAIGSTIAKLTPVKIKTVYLYRFLQSKFNYINSNTRGTGIPHVDPAILWSIEIPIPPLAEQERIVAKLDSLFAELDTIKERLANIPTILKNFRQSVLNQAVTGKLTEKWREKHHNYNLDELFEKIDEERKGYRSKKIRENKINLRNDLNLFRLSDSWKWVNLFYFIDNDDMFRYGVVQPGKEVEGEQKLIRVKDLSRGKILIDQLRGISFEIDSKYKTAKVKEGDLLVSIVGTIGRTAIIQKSSEGFNIARALAKLPLKYIKPFYVKIFIDSSIGQNWLIGDAREVARKTLNLEQLKTLPIPVPPLEEQQEIVKRVEALFKQADSIQTHYEALVKRIEVLPQAMLAKAFKGELVPQLPTDGDAKELLEEIKKLKSAVSSSAVENKKKRVVKK